jgi:hypothetical protein
MGAACVSGAVSAARGPDGPESGLIRHWMVYNRKAAKYPNDHSLVCPDVWAWGEGLLQREAPPNTMGLKALAGVLRRSNWERYRGEGGGMLWPCCTERCPGLVPSQMDVCEECALGYG